MKIELCWDVAEFAEEAVRHVVAAYDEAIAARGRFVLGLTGGSTPAPIHRALATSPHAKSIDWSKVEIVFGDERAVPPDAKESNYRAAHETLLSLVPIPSEHVHRMQGERSDLAAAARDYEALLRERFDFKIDLLFVGLGKDAHVFSLYPGSPALDETTARVVAELDPPMNPKLSRITFTPKMLEGVSLVVAIATGAEKADALRAAYDLKELDPHQYPAHIPKRAPRCVWVCDQDAGAKLGFMVALHNKMKGASTEPKGSN